MLTVTACDSLDAVVAATGVVKATDAGLTLRSGFVEAAVIEGCGSVSPSTVAFSPSTLSDIASLEGVPAA